MNLARFDLVTLGLFVAVVRQGSISAGGRQTHLAGGAPHPTIRDREVAVGAAPFFPTPGGGPHSGARPAGSPPRPTHTS